MKTGAQTSAQRLTQGVYAPGAGKLWGDYRRRWERGITPPSEFTRRDPKAPDAGLRKFSWQSDD